MTESSSKTYSRTLYPSTDWAKPVDPSAPTPWRPSDAGEILVVRTGRWRFQVWRLEGFAIGYATQQNMTLIRTFTNQVEAERCAEGIATGAWTWWGYPIVAQHRDVASLDVVVTRSATDD